jgi:hypothetical protein
MVTQQISASVRALTPTPTPIQTGQLSGQLTIQSGTVPTPTPTPNYLSGVQVTGGDYVPGTLASNGRSATPTPAPQFLQFNVISSSPTPYPGLTGPTPVPSLTDPFSMYNLGQIHYGQ